MRVSCRKTMCRFCCAVLTNVTFSEDKPRYRTGVRRADVSINFMQDVGYLNIGEKFTSGRYLVLEKIDWKMYENFFNNTKWQVHFGRN
jgi:hypothetical protein